MCTAKRRVIFFSLFSQMLVEKQPRHPQFLHNFRPDHGQTVERPIQGVERTIQGMGTSTKVSAGSIFSSMHGNNMGFNLGTLDDTRINLTRNATTILGPYSNLFLQFQIFSQLDLKLYFCDLNLYMCDNKQPNLDLRSHAALSRLHLEASRNPKLNPRQKIAKLLRELSKDTEKTKEL